MPQQPRLNPRTLEIPLPDINARIIRLLAHRRNAIALDPVPSTLHTHHHLATPTYTPLRIRIRQRRKGVERDVGIGTRVALRFLAVVVDLGAGDGTSA